MTGVEVRHGGQHLEKICRVRCPLRRFDDLIFAYIGRYRPPPRRFRPRPGSRSLYPACVRAGVVNATAPLSVADGTLAPSAASQEVTTPDRHRRRCETEDAVPGGRAEEDRLAYHHSFRAHPVMPDNHPAIANSRRDGHEETAARRTRS